MTAVLTNLKFWFCIYNECVWRIENILILDFLNSSRNYSTLWEIFFVVFNRKKKYFCCNISFNKKWKHHLCTILKCAPRNQSSNFFKKCSATSGFFKNSFEILPYYIYKYINYVSGLCSCNLMLLSFSPSALRFKFPWS